MGSDRAGNRTREEKPSRVRTGRDVSGQARGLVTPIPGGLAAPPKKQRPKKPKTQKKQGPESGRAAPRIPVAGTPNSGGTMGSS